MPPPRLLPHRIPAGSAPAKARPDLADDILRGSAAIMAHLDLAKPKQLYNMIARGKRKGQPVPIFNDGTGLCARKSGLDSWYERMERATLEGAGGTGG